MTSNSEDKSSEEDITYEAPNFLDHAENDNEDEITKTIDDEVTLENENLAKKDDGIPEFEKEDAPAVYFEAEDIANFKSCKVRKKYLGGYRHKLTGVEYHHAQTQTLPSPWKYDQVERFERDCQVVITSDQYQQTPKDSFTQVDVRGLYIVHAKDRILPVSNNYVYADDIEKRRLEKVIIIQKYARVWLARRELLNRKKIALLQVLWDKENEKQHKKLDTEWLQELKRRRRNPITKDDFTLLFSDLQKWWSEEAMAIAEARTGADLKAAMWMLVDAEVKKIEEINIKRKSAEEQQELEGKQRFLSKTAEPQVWKAYKKTIVVETEETHKGETLHGLYTTLCIEGLSTQDRIDALITLKEMVKVHSCSITDNILQLANREIDLLLRGTKPKLLEGLRTRIRNLFWQYSRQPIFNPAARKLSRMKRVDNVAPHILSCTSCKHFYILPPDSNDEVIGMSVLEKRFIKCKNCHYLENESWIRKDLELQKRILHLLILEEEKKPSVSGMIYLLRPTDIGYLIEKVWRNQSCLSGSTNVKELEFSRWNMKENWTPWNCVLVTRHEAEALNNLTDPKIYYDGKFRKIVARRHFEARKYFSRIPRFLPYLSEKFDCEDLYVSSDEEIFHEEN